MEDDSHPVTVDDVDVIPIQIPATAFDSDFHPDSIDQRSRRDSVDLKGASVDLQRVTIDQHHDSVGESYICESTDNQQHAANDDGWLHDSVCDSNLSDLIGVTIYDEWMRDLPSLETGLEVGNTSVSKLFFNGVFLHLPRTTIDLHLHIPSSSNLKSNPYIF
ncbi:hypothetical protein E3N88_15385 [Mikania micrantha]|uniref:Uncharacterized protein n=1 Tax=Mikania micrantha TaxID=192012 RepID=A0A5N6NYF8_9ASTR|nr:hypothetical protein E3N88_15385 [Mikania micrantha]